MSNGKSNTPRPESNAAAIININPTKNAFIT
jgi:hypothetical protein